MGLFKRKPKQRKNVSQKVRNGTAVLTRDEYFEDNNGYKKEKYKDKPNVMYREATVVDSNRDNELAIIKHQSSGKYSVTNKNGQRRKYNTYIKTKDDEGQPIKLGKKFQRAKPNYDVTEKQANKMKKQSLKTKNAKARKENKNALRELKGRKHKSKKT